MSDTDDTDLLLLIPPNFFSVQSSDSEDLELKRTDFKRHKYEIERTVVNDLITQVNELESRVCAIESVDSSCSTSCVNSRFNGSVDSFDIKNAKLMHDNTLRFLQMSKDSQLTGSLENIGLDKISALFDNQRSPIKLRHQYSLPATPVSVEKKSNHPFEVVRAFVSNHNLDRSATSNSNHTQVIDASSNLGSQNDCNSNVQSGVCEINSNEFETITTNNSEEISLPDFNVLAENESNRMNEQANCNSDSVKVHSKPSFQMSRSNMLNSNDESELFLKNLRNEPDSNQSNKSSTKHLELCEVDKLLKEMEETQCEIERKLKTREIHYNMSRGDDINKVTCYQTGTTIGSVPNLGFGVRNILYSNNEKESGDINKHVNINRPNPSDPGIEEICTQTKITTLGRSTDRNSEFVNTKYISPFASPLLKTPLKSDRPGTSDNNESSYYKARKKIIFSPSKLPAKSLSRSTKKLGSDQVTNYKLTNSNLETGLLGNNSDFFKRDHMRVIDDNDVEDDNSSSDEKKIDKEPRKQTRTIKSNTRLFDSSEDNPNSGHDMRPSNTNIVSRRVLGLRPSDTRANHLMSLSELWNDQKSDETNSTAGSDPVKLSQKLEEEKFKRQHCEQLIHELQKRILDDQERIAVAVQVDKEKDVAIKRLWAGWQQLATHWHELEEQRNNLSNQLESQTKAFETQAEDIKKKVELWEKELSQALDLAAGYKEKCQLISQEREEFRLKMESKFQEALDKLSATKDESVRYFEEKNNLMEKLTRFETESEKISLGERLQNCLYFMRILDKQLVAEYQKKLADVEHKLNQLEAEICILRQQKENLTLKLRDEHTRTKASQEQKMALQQVVDDYKKREKLLKDEVKNATERLELARVELRTLYQGQLEAVVKDKLREFQSQLNAAEAALRAELLSREKEIAEQAAQQCYNLAESHKIEMATVEERFRSQLKMLNMKMKEVEYQKYEAEKKFSNEKERRREIAHKLHSIMETQWRQALKIISSTAASGDGKDKVEGKYEDIELDLDALNKSLSNSGSSSNQDTTPFVKNDGQATYRLVTANSVAQNRNSNLHHHHNLQQQQQQQLQLQQRQQQQQQQHHELQHGLKKYIHMLLDRTPGNPVPGELDQSATSGGQEEMSSDFNNMTSDSAFSFFSNKTEPPKEQERTAIQQKAFMDTIGEGKQNLQSARVYRSQKPWK